MRKVLVADSANITHFMLERILGKEGFKVLYVKYPRDLISQVKDMAPDVIFLEPEISGGKGKKIVEYLVRQPETRSIPIILITRITDTNKYKMDLWPGVHQVIRKPLSSEKVLEAVQGIAFPDTKDLDNLFRQSDVG